MRNLAFALFLLLPVPACDATTPFEPSSAEHDAMAIIYQNGSNDEIIGLWTTRCSDAEWGQGTPVSIDPGQTYTVPIDTPGCYDLAVRYESLRDVGELDVQIVEGQTYTWVTP